MNAARRVCVYCGSRVGSDPRFAAAARAMAAALAARGCDLVYGGGRVGLMGIVADEMLARGRQVFGVIPRSLFAEEVAHRGVTELFEVGTMHERKAKMAELAHGFVALPGGLGTLEEIFEALTWTQIGVHGKPCGLLDVGGYFGGLLAFLESTVAAGFVDRDSVDGIAVSDDPGALLDELLG